MNIKELTDGLTALGFTTGYAAKDGDPAEIILWENDEPQPTDAEILAASSEGAYHREMAQIKQTRQSAYQQTADPLFFKWQAGEATEQEWLDARSAVVEANPYPEETK